MKNGFSLIELLIVMVMVGALVAVALPKYNRAVERGRALEGINNVRYAAQYLSIKQDLGQSVPENVEDLTKGNNFTLNFNAGSVTATRSGGWGYTLTATVNNNDEVTVTCSPSNVCEELGLTPDDLLK